MLRATKIVPAGIWHGTPADVVRLDYDRRTRRRMTLVGSGGLSFLLDLAKAPVLRSGDGIRLEDGRIVRVEAAPERLLEITCADERALARIAWHLGNRHLATELGDRIIHIRDDHVIAEMVAGSAPPCARSNAPSTPKAAPTATAPSTATATGIITAHDHHHEPLMAMAVDEMTTSCAIVGGDQASYACPPRGGGDRRGGGRQTSAVEVPPHGALTASPQGGGGTGRARWTNQVHPPSPAS